MKVGLKASIHNRFDIEVRNAKTGELEQTAVAENIVLNQMYSRLCNGSRFFDYIHYGTGTTDPQANNTKLNTFLGYKLAITESSEQGVPLTVWKRKIVLNPEDNVGAIISEVGIAYGTSNTSLVTHALLKNSEGELITIEKTADNVITIFATLFSTLNNDNPGLVFKNPKEQRNFITSYLANNEALTAENFIVWEVTGGFTQTSLPTLTWTADIPNRERRSNVARLGITAGNGDIKGFSLSNLFDVEFPNLAIHNGESYKDVPIGIGTGNKKVFFLPSKYVKPESIEIKVDGLVRTDYEIQPYTKEFIGYNPTAANSTFSGGMAFNQKAVCTRYGNIPYYIELMNKQYIKLIDSSQTPPRVNSVCVGAKNVDMYLDIGAANNSFIREKVDDTWVTRPFPTYGVGSVNCNAGNISSDGNIILLAGANPFWKVYDWDGTDYIVRPDPIDKVATIVSEGLISDDGNFVVLRHNDNTLSGYDWDGTEWTKRNNTSSLPSTMHSMALSSNGKVLAIGTNIPPEFAWVWDYIDGDWVKRNPYPALGDKQVGISLDGSIVFTAQTAGSPSSILFHNYINGEWIIATGVVGGSGTVNAGPIIHYMGDDIIFLTNSSGSYAVRDFSKNSYCIIFATDLASGVTVTADYTVDGVHKTINQVIDIDCTIQFGEGAP